MQALRNVKTLAVVLQTQKLRENDLLVRLLSESEGKIGAVARGVLKSRQRFPGGIDLWDTGYFEFEGAAKNGLFVLSSVSERQRWPLLREDLGKLCLVSFMTEVVGRLTEESHQEDGKLCRPFIKAISLIHQAPTPVAASELEPEVRPLVQQAAVAFYFIARTLRELGYDLSEHEHLLGRQTPEAEWLLGMLEQEQPIAPYNPRALPGALGVLSSAVEEIIGSELKSKFSVVNLLASLERSRN